MVVQKRIVKPQPGYQMKALSCGADIVIGGAAAGVGKTFTLLLDPLRDIRVPGFGGVIFRRTNPQIRNEGGLWDTSMQLYPHAGGEPRETFLEWVFKGGTKIKFSHLEYEKNILDWQGAQIPFIGFDELTHFSRKMFFYLLTRNRSSCGVAPYVRATCNPDPESWVADFISWWIDPDTGFPISERDGVIRYMIVDGESTIWGDTAEEVIEKAWYLLEPLIKNSGVKPKDFVKSVAFVSGSIYDNKELLNVNPGYLANLLSQDEQTRSSLLHGNWKMILSDDDLYSYPAFVGMFENVYRAIGDKKYITADIALKGSDKFVVGVWSGFELIDILIMDRSDGKEVIDAIVTLAKQYRVPNDQIVYDNDGVGGFIDGFIRGSHGFQNGGSAKNNENYQNLKTQCYYKSGDRVNKGEYKVSADVANQMYDTKETVRQRLVKERKAIKRAKVDADGKLRIIPKEQMKVKLGGQSPDMMDMFMMREYFELTTFHFRVAVA